MTDLDAIRARLDAATPGPWFLKVNDLIGGHCVMPVDATPAEVQVPEVADFAREADAEFIAHAPTDIAALLAEVDRLHRVIDHYGTHDEDCGAWTDGGCDCGWDEVSAQIPTADEPLDGDAS